MKDHSKLFDSVGTASSKKKHKQTLMQIPCGSAGKESSCNAEDMGSIPWFGRSPGEGKGNPLQYSGLENSMDGGDW